MSKEYRYFETKEEAFKCAEHINYGMYKNVEIKHIPETYMVGVTLDGEFEEIAKVKEWQVSRERKTWFERLFCGF